MKEITLEHVRQAAEWPKTACESPQAMSFTEAQLDEAFPK